MKTKTYGPVFIRPAADGGVRYGDGVETIHRNTPPAGTPAEILLAAIGACMVLSIGIVAAQRGISLAPFHVAVSATKSPDPPCHFGQYRIRVSAGMVSDPELAAELVERAKSICTISNSVTGEIALELDR